MQYLEKDVLTTVFGKIDFQKPINVYFFSLIVVEEVPADQIDRLYLFLDEKTKANFVFTTSEKYVRAENSPNSHIIKCNY